MKTTSSNIITKAAEQIEGKNQWKSDCLIPWWISCLDQLEYKPPPATYSSAVMPKWQQFETKQTPLLRYFN